MRRNIVFLASPVVLSVMLAAGIGAAAASGPAGPATRSLSLVRPAGDGTAMGVAK
jgi:hypothetical protein